MTIHLLPTASRMKTIFHLSLFESIFINALKVNCRFLIIIFLKIVCEKNSYNNKINVFSRPKWIENSYCTDWTIQLFGSSVIRTWKTYMFNKIIFKRRTLGRFKISIDCDLLKSVINKCIRLFIVLKYSNSFKVLQLVSPAVTCQPLGSSEKIQVLTFQ